MRYGIGKDLSKDLTVVFNCLKCKHIFYQIYFVPKTHGFQVKYLYLIMIIHFMAYYTLEY